MIGDRAEMASVHYESTSVGDEQWCRIVARHEVGTQADRDQVC